MMPKTISIAINLLGLFVILSLGVDLFYRVIGNQLEPTGPPEVTMRQPAVLVSKPAARTGNQQAIVKRNIFGTTGKHEDTVKTEDVEALEPTTLQVSLLGTVAGSREGARAIILNRTTKTQSMFQIGDTIQGASIEQIFRSKVVLRVDGHDEVLTMEESSRAASKENRKGAGYAVPSSANAREITVQRADIQKSLTNINQILTQVRIRPYFKNGKADGLIISHLKPNSMFTKLGLQNGDIIRTINNKPIKTPDDAIALYENLKSGSRIAMEVTRKGRDETLNYNIRE